MQFSVAFPTVSQPVSITGYIYAKLLACNFYIESIEHVNSTRDKNSSPIFHDVEKPYNGQAQRLPLHLLIVNGVAMVIYIVEYIN